jgi:hypothetical protein
MLDQLLPRRVDNTYRGHPLGLWLFVLIVLAKIANSFASIFYGYVAASGADGIPLDTFTPPAARRPRRRRSCLFSRSGDSPTSRSPCSAQWCWCAIAP